MTSGTQPTTPEGTSSLLGMFQPPPESAGDSAESKDASHEAAAAAKPSVTSPSNSAGAASAASPSKNSTSNLLGMFEPPSNDSGAAVESPNTTPPKPPSSSLTAFFEPPTPARVSIGSASPGSPPQFGRERPSLLSTVRHVNKSSIPKETTDSRPNEQTNLLQSIFTDNDAVTPRIKKNTIQSYDTTDIHNNVTFESLLAPPRMEDQMEPSSVHYVPVKQPLDEEMQKLTASQRYGSSETMTWKEWLIYQFQPTTFAGAFMFLLYHVVFCLANGSAIVRPHANKPILGEMAKLTAVGIFAAGPFFIARLGSDVPAVYPSVDLFLAPFLAAAAVSIDNTLAEEGITGHETNDIFFATFAVLASIGMFSAGLLLLLAATFKLANLGTFLPYSVLCGFFSAVGVLLWALSFSVDTNGKTWQHVFFSGDTELILTSLKHHIPTLVVGILMNLLGPKHPFYVILLIILTLFGFYTTLWITGTSLEDAQHEQWFWSREELSIQATNQTDDGGLLEEWVPPIPFGHFGAILGGKVHWKAVKDGLPDMFTLAFLYLLRSSIHASAMKKNINNLVCKTRVKKKITQEKPEGPKRVEEKKPEPTSNNPKNRRHKRDESYAKSAMDAITDNVRLINESLADTTNASGTFSVRLSIPPMPQSPAPKLPELSSAADTNNKDEYDYIEVRPKPCRRSLQSIFVEYGFALWSVSLAGGFGVCPTVATSNTMYAIGAGGSAPQYGSCLLLIIFYATDFELVRFIPKACFSSLLVLGAIDTFVVWFILSYKKTQDLMEWLVVPTIVAFSLVVGFLNAVFLGVGISTFVFVASFFRVGVVKFNATGLEIRSTIERSQTISDWLDTHGDYIQVLVLQNYLFFGNASSVLNYIGTMFETVEESEMVHSSFELPPVPKVLILDMSLNTGMDTSTLDIFAEIKELCKNNNCKLFLCGLSNRAKKGLALTGVKPEGGIRDLRKVRFFSDLDTALGRAEDLISMEVAQKEEESSFASSSPSKRRGFHAALKYIDEQHGREFSKDLLELEAHTVALELQPGERLFASDGGLIHDAERGLIFIESGMLRIEKDANETLTRGHSTMSRNRGSYGGTLNNLHARSGTLGKQRAAFKASTREPLMSRTFRLARIGPGWVCGAIEGASGLKNEGVHMAVTHCRVYHLSFQKLAEIEKINPRLILSLYKMLSHLMTRRQEITIEQLATFHSIMSAPAHSKPISRSAMMAMRG